MSEYEYGMGKKRGPYGTNVGDMWLTDESAIKLRRERENVALLMVIEIMDKGDGPEETVYMTVDPVLMAEAAEGHLRLMAERGMPNAFQNWVRIKAAKN
jgi:hypothetical protein